MNAVIARQSSVAQAGLKLDDLQVGKTASSSAVTSPEVGQAIKNAVDSWHKEYSTKPGYRSGSTYAPEQMRETIEVSSALQLPAILAKLHGPDAHNVRLQFPQPASGSEEERAAIRAEQVAIHKFLQTSHGKDLGELLQEVKGLIENSASFKRDKGSGLLPPEMTADLWIRASVGEKLEQIAKLPQKLDVSDVVEIGSKKIESVKASLELALKEAVESSRGLIITVPDTEKSAEKREQLRELLKRFVEEREKLPDFSEETLARIKVWVGVSKRDITTGPAAGEPSAKVEAFSILDFLRGKQTEDSPEKEKSGRVDQEAVSPSSKTSSNIDDEEVTSPTRQNKTQPKEEESATAKSPREEDAFSFEYLVMPSNEKLTQIDTYANDKESAA